jgi:hypothetical protein
VESICKHIREGMNNKDSCLMEDISEETFYTWQKENNADGTPNTFYHPEFSESLKKAELWRKEQLIKRILLASDKEWQAAAWYLERVFNKEFARRTINQEENKNADEGIKLLRALFIEEQPDDSKNTELADNPSTATPIQN